MRKYIIVILLLNCSIIMGQLLSGPMTGSSGMREASVWVQLESQGKVSIEYWNINEPEVKFRTHEITSDSKVYEATTIRIIDLEPGNKYGYNVLVNGSKSYLPYPATFETQTLWQYRDDPPDFSFLTGSCVFINETAYDRPGNPYGGSYHIFNTMNKEKSEFMVWLGDNTYLREVDFDSRSGVFHRYTHSRKVKELQSLLASKHHYAIWDDHDYGPNDSNYAYHGKQWTKEAFTHFWANPTYGAGETEGITGYFEWADCAFYLLDNRWYRDSEDPTSILGKKQTKWLLEALSKSNASFNIICVGGQVLSPAKVHENFANYEMERKILLEEIEKRQIKNVVFLTGDRHHSELSKFTSDKGYIMYDVTASPMTSSASSHLNEKNIYRIDGSHFGIRNYAKISVRGTLKERVMRMEFYDELGKSLFSHDLEFDK